MRKTQIWESRLGTGADQALLFDLNGPLPDLKACSGYNRFIVRTLTGSVRVKGSLDGETYDQQLTMSQEPGITNDLPDDQVGTLVAVTTAGALAFFEGDYRSLKFEQVGATAAQIVVLGAANA